MTTDPFARPMPAVGGGETYPANFQLVGRLLIFWVRGVNRGVQSSFQDNQGNPLVQDQVIADTAVLDGEPLLGKVDYTTRQPKEPFPFPLTAPIEFEGMIWSQKLLVSSLAGELNTGRPVLARLVYGPKRGQNSPPMKLEDPTPADVELGKRYLAQRDQIKAHWAQRFQAAGLGPVQNNSPFHGQQQQYGAQPGQYAGLNIPQYGSPQPQQQAPSPVQDQPWNPYNGQQQGHPQTQALPQWQPQSSQGPVQQQFHEPLQAYNPEQPSQGWTPTPDGPPPGWGNQQ